MQSILFFDCVEQCARPVHSQLGVYVRRMVILTLRPTRQSSWDVRLGCKRDARCQPREVDPEVVCEVVPVPVKDSEPWWTRQV